MSFSPLVLTCMHGRPDVTDLFVSSMNSHGMQVLAAVSDDDSAESCYDGGVSFFYYDNEPLSDKWNSLVSVSLNFAFWTHVVISGDDNLYSSKYISRIEEYKNLDYYGLGSYYAVDPIDRRACHFRQSSFAIGPGRVLSRRVVEQMVDNGGLFHTGLSSGLDYSSDMMLTDHGYKPVLIDGDRTMVVDVKCGMNVWGYDTIAAISEDCTYSEATSFLTPMEYQRLSKIKP